MSACLAAFAVCSGGLDSHIAAEAEARVETLHVFAIAIAGASGRHVSTHECHECKLIRVRL